MQDMGGNGKSTGLVGRIRERIHDWEFHHPWIARPYRYFALLVVVLGACYCAFNYFDLYHTDADSARYMLSAMVQAQAAIIAIVITLTLIAVQLTASAYSPRVIRVFRNNPDMWLLLGFYGFSMLYGLVVLKMVVGGVGEVVSQDVFWSLGCVSISFEFCVSFAYWLEVFTLVALFPYMLNIIGLLEAETIIQRLAIKITKKGILNSKDDPIQPIMDIIHGAAMKYDLATTRIGLKVVTDRVIGITHSDGQEDIDISSHFCDHLGRVGRLTASKMDEESTREVIKNLRNFGRSTAKNGFGGAAREAAKSLGDVGKASAGQGLGDAAWHAAKSLGDVGKASAEKGLSGVAKSAAWNLGLVGKAAAKNKLKKAISQAVASLGDVGTSAVEKGLEDAACEVAKSLREIGTSTAEKDLEDAACEVAKSLREIGMTAAGKGFENATLEVVNSLGAVGIAVAERGLINVAFHIAESLGQIGMAAAKNELEDTPQRAAKCLAHIGKITAEGGGEFEAVTIQAIESIGDIGKQEGATFYAGYLIRVGETTVKQKLKNETWTVVKSIGQVGMAAAEKGDDVAKNVIPLLDSYLNTIKRSAGGTELAEWAIKKAAEFLIEIGVFAIEHDLNDVAQEHAECFVKWTAYMEGDVYDLFGGEWLTSGRHEHLRKFREIYEELRTQTPYNTSQH